MPIRLTSLVVLVLLLTVSVLSWLAARMVADTQEERLLAARTDEVVLVLQSSVTNIQSSLRVLGTVSAVHENDKPFAASASPMLRDDVAAVGVAEKRGAGFVAVDALGRGPQVGETLGATRSTLATRALDSGQLAAGLVQESGTTRVAIVIPVEAADRAVAYQESIVDPTSPAPSEPGSPFAELDLALYASPQADPDQLVLTTTREIPLTGRVERTTVPVGADQWTMLARSREPLAGPLTRQVPWVLFGVGVAVAVIVASFVEMIGRRRRYATAVADQRTAELRQALTDLHRARETAETANEAKTEFLSRMSHELRTPLNAVLGFAQLLTLTDLDDEQRDHVAHIDRGGRHLLSLIDEVLDISRIDSGGIALSPEPLHVSEVVTESIDLVRPMAAQHEVQIAGGRATACQAYIFADRQRLKQVLLNLLSNAVKYNRQGGTVAVSCHRPTEDRLRITVADTGPGIRTEDLPRLFSPFERLGAEQGDVEGTGIGLALSQRLTTAMGGELDLTTQPGKGSTFWVEFTIVEEPENRYIRLSDNTSPTLHPRGDITDRHKILYIEDNLANLRLVETIFAQRGDVEIIPAMQGGLGVELAREHRPRLVLLDLHLPDLGGEHVLHRLRDDPDTTDIPVVIVTADATPRQAQRLLAAGARAYLTKPLEVPELLRLVDDILAPAHNQPPQ